MRQIYLGNKYRKTKTMTISALLLYWTLPDRNPNSYIIYKCEAFLCLFFHCMCMSLYAYVVIVVSTTRTELFISALVVQTGIRTSVADGDWYP